MRTRALLLAAAGVSGALLCAAAPAAADTQLSIAGGVLYTRNTDVGVANQMRVDPQGSRVHFVDEADPRGFTFPVQQCSPGRLNSAGNPVEVTCEREGYARLTFELGPGEDRLAYAIDDLPANVSGELGADALTTGAAADSLNGGQGNDTLEAGAGDDALIGDDGDDVLRAGDGNDRLNGGVGADLLDAGAGDDQIIAADGVQDTIDCGAGADSVNADTTDRLVNCETEKREQVAEPPGTAGGGTAGPAGRAAAEDDVRPVLQAGGSSSQRVSSRRRRVTLAVSVSERALVSVSGYLDAGAINDKVRPTATRVVVPGGGVYLRVTLSAKQVRRVLRDVRRKRRPRLKLTISAVDAAGNTSPPRRLTIALRR